MTIPWTPPENNTWNDLELVTREAYAAELPWQVGDRNKTDAANAVNWIGEYVFTLVPQSRTISINGEVQQFDDNIEYTLAIPPDPTDTPDTWLFTDGNSQSWRNIDLATGVGISGPLAPTLGGTGTGTSFTAGSIPFIGASGVYSQNNSALYWNNSTLRMGIRNASPTALLSLGSPTVATGTMDMYGVTSGVVKIQAADAAGTWTWIVPTSAGTAQYTIINQGSGVTQWGQVSLTAGVTGILPPANGGTGVNNGSATLTMAGSHVLSGAYSSTFTFTNTTSVTFPTSGTLATLSDIASGYVPYIGAATDVNIGTHTLSSRQITITGSSSGSGDVTMDATSTVFQFNKGLNVTTDEAITVETTLPGVSVFKGYQGADLLVSLTNTGDLSLGAAGLDRGQIFLHSSNSGVVSISASVNAITEWNLNLPTAAPAVDGYAFTGLIDGTANWTNITSGLLTGFSASAGTVGPSDTILQGFNKVVGNMGGLTGFANPTGTIGLTAVNGVATTAMRSDSAPALSQAIIPTWTGTHTYTNTTLGLSVSSITPVMRMVDTNAAVDQKTWQWSIDAGELLLTAANDALNSSTTAISYQRSGATVTGVKIWSAPLTLGTIASSTGTLILAGSTSGQATVNVNATASVVQVDKVVQATGVYIGATGTDLLYIQGAGAVNAIRGVVKNTTSTGDSQLVAMNNSNNYGLISKSGSAYVTYKTISANDTAIYNSTAAGNITILNDYASGAILLTAGASATAHVTIASTGAVRFNTYGAGTLTTDASGNITATSDERLKTNINPYLSGLEQLKGIVPISYKWTEASGNDMDNIYAGFSAQNVRDHIPHGVGEYMGYLTIQDRPILATVVNAIKELEKQIKDLKTLL